MSRSNGPGAPPNGWPADFPAPDAQGNYPDPYYPPQPRQQAQQPITGRPARIQNPPPARNPQAGQPSGGYAQPGGYPPPQGGPAAGHHGQPPYAPAQPQAGYSQPPSYAPQPQYPPQARQPYTQAPPNDPRFGGYQGYEPAAVPPTRPPHQYPTQNYAPPTPAPQAPAYIPEPTTRTQPPHTASRAAPSLDNWSPTQPQQRPSPPAIDPHGYDLGTYMPSSIPTTPDPRSQRPVTAPAWQPYGDQPRTQPPGREAEQGPAHHPGYSADHGGALEPVADEGDYEDEEFEEPRRARYGLIAASLLGAIAVGGGLAYAYKTFVAPPTQLAGTPVVKGASAPAKVKPADPGGTKFADPGPKMMESLSGAQQASASNPDGAPRTVQTLRIEKDGTITNSTSPSPPPPASSPAVPGLIIAGLPPAAPQPAAASEPVVVQPPPAARGPQRVTVASALPAAASPPVAVDSAPAAAPLPPAKKTVVKKPPTQAAALGGPAPAPATTGSSGFVAVLASVPVSGSSKMQAMQQFADLQQRFSGVLGGKTPDVVDATVKSAPYHRLVVGPPGSRDAASSLCKQLKEAGYTSDCWVTAY